MATRAPDSNLLKNRLLTIIALATTAPEDCILINYFSDPQVEEYHRLLHNAFERDLADRTNDFIRKHKQNYRMLKLKYPEIKLDPYFIGESADDGIKNTFLFGLQEGW